MTKNKDLLNVQQRRLGAMLKQAPTIIDPGYWYWAEVGTREPNHVVDNGIFGDAWPKTWTEMGPCGAQVLSEPSPQYAVLLIPTWGDGFDRLKLLIRPYFALGWENLTANTRIHFPRCHVGSWEGYPIVLAEQHYSEVAKRKVPYSMFTTGSTNVERDVMIESEDGGGGNR
jgi:hypothetical protein